MRNSYVSRSSLFVGVFSVVVDDNTGGAAVIVLLIPLVVIVVAVSLICGIVWVVDSGGMLDVMMAMPPLVSGFAISGGGTVSVGMVVVT